MTALKYRLAIVEKLLEKHYSSDIKSNTGRPSTSLKPLWLTKRPFLEYIPPTRKKQAPTRQCVCYLQQSTLKGRRYGGNQAITAQTVMLPDVFNLVSWFTTQWPIFNFTVSLIDDDKTLCFITVLLHYCCVFPTLLAETPIIYSYFRIPEYTQDSLLTLFHTLKNRIFLNCCGMCLFSNALL